MEEKNTGSLCINITVDGLTRPEVMQSMRRLMVKPYLILWLAVYVVMAVVMLVTKKVTIYTLFGPAVILLLLWGAYEYSGYKNFDKMGYDKVVMNYQLTPGGFTLTVGEQTGEVKWADGWIKETKSDLLLYSGKNNCSILPKRCLKEGEKEKILGWGKKQG